MTVYANLKKELKNKPKSWLVTGAAGFIGSHLVQSLLLLNQKVTGVDNFSTGYRHNLEAVRVSMPSNQWKNFIFYEADICDFELCQKVSQKKDYVLHSAALDYNYGSFAKPLEYNDNNVTGFLNVLEAAKLAKVQKLVYASSSVLYNDEKQTSKPEYSINYFSSPLALTKYINELYSEIYARCYNFHAVGLRYFNVFGPRQDPIYNSDAVIPQWFDAFYNQRDVIINGGGGLKRDFCYVDNIVQANLLAATTSSPYTYSVYNVASGQATSLINLFSLVRAVVEPHIKADLSSNLAQLQAHPVYRALKKGELNHSQADITRIVRVLHYETEVSLIQGLEKTANWYANAKAFQL